MTLSIAVAAATILLLGLGALCLVRYLGRDHLLLPVTTDWLNDLSTDRYRPMLRLLDAADFRFLCTQEGFTPEMTCRLRRQRVQAFRGYLGLLEADFDRVGAALRVILTHSAYDRPELASLLFQRRLSFAFGLLGIHCRILLFQWGWSCVDVSGLIRLFDGMRIELRTLVPLSSPLAA